jgi:carboxylesterase type B
MAADNVATTSLYSCPIHNILEHTPFGEAEQDMFVFVFDRHDLAKPDALITHSCELNYLFDPDSTDGPKLSTQMQTWWTNMARY